MTAPQTWLPTTDAARAAGITVKALRRRIERGTVVSELRDDGRRHVLLESINGHGPAPTPPRRGALPGQRLPPSTGQDEATAILLARLEQLAAENGRLRALTQIAESTEQRLVDELHQQRARTRQLEAELAQAGLLQAWRIARRLRTAGSPT